MTAHRTERDSHRATSQQQAGDSVLYVVTNSMSLPFLRDQIEYLIERDVRVSVATRLVSDASETVDSRAALYDISFEREPSLGADLRALWKAIQLVRRLRPTVVAAATPKAGLLAMLAATVCRIPRRVYIVWGLRFETTTGWRRRLLLILERVTAICATDVLFNSPSLRKVAVRHRIVAAGRARLLGGGSGSGNCVCLERFDVLPGASDARHQLGLPADAVVVGFVGRLTLDKGLVDLVSLFDTDSLDAELLLVGQFEAGDTLPEETLRTIDEQPRIHHVHWMSETSAAYAAMDILAFPSYREGLPNVPMEAQRCGVPVVAYAATGTVDAVHHDVGGRLVEVGDTAALGRELSTLIDQPERRRELAKGGRAFVLDHLDPAPCWDQLLELYKR